MADKPEIKSDKATALYYIKTFSDTAREPVLILEYDLTVVAANAPFYKNFQVTKEETENKLIYELGNGQWDIPELRKLLEDILPNKKIISDFEVTHKFPRIGLKTMMLNARQFDNTRQIILVIEDVTLKKAIKTKLANYTEELEANVALKTKELKGRIDELSELNRAMVGRELKMTELKKENVELKNKKS